MVVDSSEKILPVEKCRIVRENNRYAGTMTTMTMQSPEALVNALFDAFEARDFEQVRSFLSDEGFSYISPIESFANADDYVVNISRVGPILERIERCKTFVNNNDVCSILKIHTTMDRQNAASVVQLTTIAGGKIFSIEAIFDATEYNKMIVPHD